MTFNNLTLEAVCDKCSYSWRSRTGEAPKKCPKCGSMKCFSGTKKYTSIISRAGTEDPKTHYREFCTIDYIDKPSVTTDDIFYVSKGDLDRYLTGQRFPPGSALTWIGSFEIGEDNLLKILELKLVYSHVATFLSYHSQSNCIYNIASYYNKQRELKRAQEDKLIKEIMEEKRKEEAIKAARARLDAAKAKQEAEQEAERILNDDSVSNNDKMEAIKLLRR